MAIRCPALVPPPTHPTHRPRPLWAVAGLRRPQCPIAAPPCCSAHESCKRRPHGLAGAALRGAPRHTTRQVAAPQRSPPRPFRLGRARVAGMSRCRGCGWRPSAAAGPAGRQAGSQHGSAAAAWPHRRRRRGGGCYGFGWLRAGWGAQEATGWVQGTEMQLGKRGWLLVWRNSCDRPHTELAAITVGPNASRPIHA